MAKESIFSGLNNLKVNSILDNQYSEYFGFTPEEVKAIARYYHAEEKNAEICAWYDGYRFGGSEIFNPWSVINYFSNGCQPKTFWQSTGSNEIIGEILAHAGENIYERLNALLQGESFLTDIDTGVIYPQIRNNPSSVYSFLLVAGYLKVVRVDPAFSGDYMCEVALPNREIAFVYNKEILQKLVDIIPLATAISSPHLGIMKQQFGANGWTTRMEGPAPRPGQLTLWAMQSVAQGADFISFFRWRTCTVGSENYWHGILDYDNEWDTEVDVWHRRVAEKVKRRSSLPLNYIIRHMTSYICRRTVSDLTEYPAEENVWAKLQGCNILNFQAQDVEFTLRKKQNSCTQEKKQKANRNYWHMERQFTKWFYAFMLLSRGEKRLDICGFAGALLPGTGIYYLTPAKRRSVA